MMLRLTIVLALVVAAFPAAASTSAWGTLTVAAEREWTTEKEPRPRVTKFRWVEPGRVLEARHGFVSRLQFGEAKFADTVQRLTLDPKTGAINVTYTYEDGRPPLKTVMKVEPDGTLVESFTDAKGFKKRNIYRSPSPSINLIERQEMRGTTWATLGTTRKGGLTYAEIAENKRRAEEAAQLALAQANARRAAEQARREAEENARYAPAEEQSYEAPMQQGMNMLDMLNGMANSINQQNQQQQAQFDRQMRSNNSGGSSSSGGGAIIVDNTPAPTYTPPPESSAPPQAPAQPAFQLSKPTESSCSYWHRHRAGDREYEQCSPGDKDCTCADAAKVSGQ